MAELIKNQKIVFLTQLSLFSDHQFYHKWFLLTEPTDNFRKVQGFIRCDINVVAPKLFLESYKLHEERSKSDKRKQMNTILR